MLDKEPVKNFPLRIPDVPYPEEPNAGTTYDTDLKIQQLYKDMLDCRDRLCGDGLVIEDEGTKKFLRTMQAVEHAAKTRPGTYPLLYLCYLYPDLGEPHFFGRFYLKVGRDEFFPALLTNELLAVQGTGIAQITIREGMVPLVSASTDDQICRIGVYKRRGPRRDEVFGWYNPKLRSVPKLLDPQSILTHSARYR